MHFSSSKLHTWLIHSLLMIFIQYSSSQSGPRISEAGLFCGTGRPPVNTSINGFFEIFRLNMETLSERVTADSWGYYATNASAVSVYSLAQCYQDLSPRDCLLCFAETRTRLPRCLPAVSASLYLDGCFLRYDNYSFGQESVDPARDAVNCSSSIGLASGDELRILRMNVENLVDNVTAAAIANGSFAARGMNGVYGLAQCWRSLTRDGCRECLAKASAEVKGCLPSREGRGLNAGCYLRYSTQNFINSYTNTSSSDTGVSRTGRRIAIALSVSAFFMLSLFAAYAGYSRYRKRKQERKNLGKISISYNKSNLNFRYETLEKATNYFNASRKLGQGGAGSVYKGTLPNGKNVAVKRLFFNTRQWVDEFFNEVNLIHGIQHKNLLQLLGCSIEGPESLLVYEFVANRSLDENLFAAKKNGTRILNWRQRYDIIVGIAEGIAYLHGGSEMRIIHRDIKSSNILLDENFCPKVADFGLARCFEADKTHISTGIAGTLGYMSPEYLVKGQLTEKADVYSYGVLVLEIVSGRKNNVLSEDTDSLLATIWKLYKTDEVVEAIDPSLREEVPWKEATRVLQIGLLCAQASAPLRPSMAEVVEMLTDNTREILEPNQPPFLNSNLMAAGHGNLRHHGLSNLLSNALLKLEEAPSSSNTDSSSVQTSFGRPR